MLCFDEFIFINKQSGEYWVFKGRTTPDRSKATRFTQEQAARFLRTVAHPQKWKKEKF